MQTNFGKSSKGNRTSKYKKFIYKIIVEELVSYFYLRRVSVSYSWDVIKRGILHSGIVNKTSNKKKRIPYSREGSGSHHVYHP